MPEIIIQNNPITFLNNCFNQEANLERKLILNNDDDVSGTLVIEALQTITKKTYEEAIAITLEAHATGTSIIGHYPREEASDYKSQFQTYGITTTIEE